MKNNINLYKILFQPDKDFFLTGNNPLLLFQELRDLGFCNVVAQTGSIPALEAIEPAASYVSWEILLATDRGPAAIREVFVFVEDISELHIETLMEKLNPDSFPGHRRLGEILVERGDVQPEDLVQLLARQKPVGELLVDAELVSPSMVKSALAEQQAVNSGRSAVHSDSSIRVPSEKLDKLINLVGELVVTQAQLTQAAGMHLQSETLEPVKQVERLTAELRDCALGVRMLPISTLFGKFNRLVRDLAAEHHKEVDLFIEGEGTELDKTVIEELHEPLANLLRGCILYGLEAPAERETAGKSRCGRIHLAAAHVGASAIISVQDDGRGIDIEKIRLRALNIGLINADDSLGDKELLNLILNHGFEGGAFDRDFGLEEVRAAAENMNGSVEIDSEQGKGTTCTITLPLTMAIIDGLLVQAGKNHFVLPLKGVEECVELNTLEGQGGRGRRMLPVHGKLVPYVRLREFFRMHGERPAREQMVVMQADGDRVGLVLDRVIGNQQTVIKPLGWVGRDAKGLSGATILGSGEVALIVDVKKLIQQARKEEVNQ